MLDSFFAIFYAFYVATGLPLSLYIYGLGFEDTQIIFYPDLESTSRKRILLFLMSLLFLGGPLYIWLIFSEQKQLFIEAVGLSLPLSLHLIRCISVLF